MLTLSEDQWQALQASDTLRFVVAVCDQFLAGRPDMMAVPGYGEVLGRMQRAHDYALRLGFSSTPHIVRLLYLAANAPGMFAGPVIDSWLRKPGATPGQRLDDLLAVMKNKLERSD
jgi:hypothetical protein